MGQGALSYYRAAPKVGKMARPPFFFPVRRRVKAPQLRRVTQVVSRLTFLGAGDRTFYSRARAEVGTGRSCCLQLP
ncbi:hypothetical protein NDU88_001716 [Pleurodeles waltl]|uniref:Uncharacterized protein n=1 Tax=Pleurodeles waltl TaxID=8319 RepID=A0AAV7RB53_PLEWA|nr:hypothetical protein NDU88_001716 [Pleurodeles waltl]